MSCEHVQYFHQREDRCCVKFFPKPIAKRLGWNFLKRSDKIESQIDKYGCYGGYHYKRYTNKDTLQLVCQNSNQNQAGNFRGMLVARNVFHVSQLICLTVYQCWIIRNV